MWKNEFAMGVREELQKRIDRKRVEIADLEMKTREARVYIQALEDTLKILPRDSQDDSSNQTLELRSGSRVAKARDVLKKAGAPLHITDILKELGDETTPANRTALSSSIGAYVRRGELFTRPAPNTFGLTEFGTAEARKGPPPGFGKDEDTEGEKLTESGGFPDSV
jgi:hypothetical protein